jgi:hypothetical protein
MANRLQVLTSSLTEVASAAGFTAASEALKPLAEVLDVVAGLGGSLSVSVVGGLLSAAESYGSAQGWQAHAGSLAARGTTPLSIAATALDHHTRQYEATVRHLPLFSPSKPFPFDFCAACYEISLILVLCYF